jgi:hypothetical protein
MRSAQIRQEVGGEAFERTHRPVGRKAGQLYDDQLCHRVCPIISGKRSRTSDRVTMTLFLRGRAASVTIQFLSPL